MTTDRDRLIERREVAQRDLRELAAQVEAGEVAPDTAERLRAAYETELVSLDSALGDVAESEPVAIAEVESPEADPGGDLRSRRSPRTVLAWSVLLVAALTVTIGFLARGNSSPDATPAASGPGDLGVDPATVSNEQLEAVVAANPEVIAMRAALANRYFEAREYGSALGHYLYIAENADNAADESQALARIGWMAYVTDLPQEAEQYLEASLRVDPTNAEATLYRGFVTLYGLGDPAAALPQLEAALQLENLPANVISELETALEEARAGGGP